MSNRHVETPRVRLPELGDTPQSVRHYIAAVARSVSLGDMDHVIGRELGQLAKTYLAVIRHEHDVTEVEELKELVRRAEAVSRRGEAREISERQHTRVLPPASNVSLSENHTKAAD